MAPTTARAAVPRRVDLAHIPALPRPRRAAAAAALKAINAVPAAAADDDDQSGDSADELPYTDAPDTDWARSGYVAPRGAGVAQLMAAGGAVATAGAAAPAAAVAGQSKPTGGATAAAQGPWASAGQAAGGQDAPPPHVAAPAYFAAGMEKAGQPSNRLAAAVFLSGPAASPSAKLGVEPWPDAAAHVPVGAPGPGHSIYAQAVDSIEPIGAKAAAGMQEQESGRGGAVGAALALEGACRPQPAAAAGDLSDQQVCSRGVPSCCPLGASGPPNFMEKGPEGALGEKGRGCSKAGLGAGLGDVHDVTKEAGGVDMLGQADVLSNGKAANSAVGREGGAGTGTASTAVAAALLGGAALTAARAAAIPLVHAAADQRAQLEKKLSNGANGKAKAASSRCARQGGIGKQQRTESKAAKDPNGGAAGDVVPNACGKKVLLHGMAYLYEEMMPGGPGGLWRAADKAAVINAEPSAQASPQSKAATRPLQQSLRAHHTRPLPAAPAPAAEVPLQAPPPVKVASAAAAPPCPPPGMDQVAASQVLPVPPPASMHGAEGGGGLPLVAPLTVKVESGQDLPQLPSQIVAAASTAAERLPSTGPKTPVVTAINQPAAVLGQASAVLAAAAAAPATPVTGMAVKAEMHDIGSVDVAGLMPSAAAAAAAAAEVIVIDISDDEAAGASAGVGCNPKGGGGVQQAGDARPKGASVSVARVKNDVDAEFGAAAARGPAVSGAEAGVGAFEGEATVAEQAVGGQRVSGAPTAVPTVDGGEDQGASGEVARGGKHGRDGSKPVRASGGLSIRVIAPLALTPLTAVANVAGGAGAGESGDAVALADDKSMAAVVNSQASASLLPDGHQFPPAEAAAPGVAVATPVAVGSGLQAEAVNPAGSGGTSAEQLGGRGSAAAGEELAGAAVGAAASSLPSLRPAELQPTVGATAAAKKEAMAAGFGVGESETLAARGQGLIQPKAAAGAAKVEEVDVTAVHGAAATSTVGVTDAAPAARVMGEGTDKGSFQSAAGSVLDLNGCPDKAVSAKGIKKELDGEETAVTAAGGTAAAGAESGALGTAEGMAIAVGTTTDNVRLPTEVAAAAAGIPPPTATQPAAGGNGKTAVVAGIAGTFPGIAAAGRGR